VTYTETAPTLEEMVTVLSEDLRDASKKTFDDTNLIQFVNDGMVEVNRVYPLHVVDDIALVEDQSSYATRFSSVYRVEVWDGTSLVGSIPYNDGNGTYAGWELYGSTLVIPPNIAGTEMFDAYTSLSLKVAGYAKRQLLTVADWTSPLDLDPEAALGVRWFAAFRAYQTLMSDRSLYKQWQGQSNNTDVSMPMLMNLVQTASTMWERHRRNFVTYRRSPVGDPVVI
jgi:hypothetical protein